MVLLAAIVGGAVLLMTQAERRYENMSSREMASLCITHANLALHIHPHLTIKINGVAEAIQANIGITPECMRTLHTHDPDGKIHIEGPVAKEFTLGDFFFVWDKPFSKDEILGYKADATHAVSMTVNGTPVDTFENTILKDLDAIVISYDKKP